MDKLTVRKINLLVHLAHVDGKFHESERELLKAILKEKGLAEKYLEEHQHAPVQFEDFTSFQDKCELLFWTLKMIHADGELHEEEVNYAGKIATALGFRTALIGHYLHQPPQSLAQFEREIKAFQIQML
jgi:uncharacterized tellurite resistance protein B-like protein